MPNILFAALTEAWDDYETHLRSALDDEDLQYTLATDLPPAEVDYIVYAPNSTVRDFTPYTRLKAVMNLWAGVEKVVKNPTLAAPLTRMVDDEGLTQGMVEWVTGHTLRHHLGMDAHIVNPERIWDDTPPPLAKDRPVTILGLGALGQACARALTQIGFHVTGWSRSKKDVPGVTCLAGAEGLDAALTTAQILILLLPDTPATTNLINADTLARLPQGAVILNPGRGPLIDDEALLTALDANVSHATLDTFRTEPLPRDHAFWCHRRITVTPHIASTTRPDSAARVIARNIARAERGETLHHLVDRTAGY
ncbi:2-hydroxyacid dehydrogenase [Sagittula salina]|uniref:Glyoxylate/hydroxypyruvate reductase A n=1 Tax=Sagittula salina TaxID=2820268 RepID=A0A940MKU7_9RHOB|nr:glyoxylate/hydroxypyruvate reductase A [Sagittula salina]MBP0481438.1 glyoxylate/hydroxypyruvate reductase A [Sagittula salina]